MLHLGEALISDELVAMMELIKNSYDADSNNSSITVNTTDSNEFGQGLIVVKDNGSGMTLEVVESAFLKLASDYKMKHQKISPKFKRLSLGNKGIGRLALQRLGAVAHVVTKTPNGHSIEFMIDWREFSDPDKDVRDVEIDVKENSNLDSLFESNQGTIISIYGMKNSNFWKEPSTTKKFEKEVYSIIDPYSDEESKFAIYLNLDGESFSSDKYDKKYLEKLSDTKIEFSYSEESRKLLLTVTRNTKYVDYRFDAFKKELGKDNAEVTRNDNVDFYFDKEDRYEIDFNKPLETQYGLLKNIGTHLLKNKDGELYLPGDFSGLYYAFDKSPDRFDKEQRGYLDKVNGVKLFRNNFRIVPYGDEKNDWLGFTRFSQQIKYNVFRQHTVAGYVTIDGESNLSKLVEMTNRQGLIDDNYGRNFSVIMTEIITRFIVQSDVSFRNQFNISATDFDSMKNDEIKHIRKGSISIIKKSRILDELQKDVHSLNSDIVHSTIDHPEISQFKTSISNRINSLDQKASQAIKQVDQYRQMYVSERERLDQYKAVVGASIITESLAHEILGISKKIRSYISQIKNEVLKSKISKRRIDMFFDLIISSVGYLERYASVLDINSYTKRKKFEIVDIKEQVSQILSGFPLFDQSLENALKPMLDGDTFNYSIIKMNFKIAIENLIVNSQYWTKGFSESPVIHFSIDSNKREIVVWDNGPGIEKDFEDKLFDPYVSGKPDSEGRGMGLYITRSLLEEISSSIRLLNERNEQGKLFKFCIKFN
jgi:signal transduction histidine kinase